MDTVLTYSPDLGEWLTWEHYKKQRKYHEKFHPDQFSISL